MFGWQAGAAAHETPYLDSQDEIYDSRVISQEGNDDTDTLVVAIKAPGVVSDYLSYAQTFKSIIMSFVLLLEARAPPSI